MGPMIFAGKMRVGDKEDFSGVLLEGGEYIGGEYINRVKLTLTITINVSNCIYSSLN